MIRLSEKHEKFCEHRLLNKISSLKYPEQILDYPILGFKNLQKSGFKDSIKIGALIRSFNPTISAVLNFIFSLIFMIYLSPLFSGIVLILLPIAFLLVRRNSAKMVNSTIVFERNRASFIKTKKESLISALTRGENSSSITIKSLEQRDENLLMQKYFRSFYSRFLIQIQNSIIIKVLISICVFTTLVFAGYMIFYVGNLRWARLIGFVVALRIFLNSLSSLSNIINKLSKNYDYVNNYHSILLKLDEIEKSDFIPNPEKKHSFLKWVSELNDADDDDDE